MADRKRGLTADERLAELHLAQARLRWERMVRELSGPIWRRMVNLVPILFRLEGTTMVRILRAEPAQIIEALREDGVFAVDTAMRLAHGTGFLAGGDIQVYLTNAEPLERLARASLIDPAPCADTTLVRPWPGPSRLFACVVSALPLSRITSAGHRVVTVERLRRELIGAVGARADLFALLEQAERLLASAAT
ncbi:MAG: hypothetical protein ABJE95_18150 [Byssovorax sp.]